MSGCGNCCGNCGSCGSSSGCMELTMGEIEMLQTLAQIPFLPVARKMGDDTPVYLEDADKTPEEYSLILQVLEKKALIDIDYGQPLKGFDMAAYKGLPVHGSFALTARGQQVLEMLEIQGLSEE